MSDVMECRSREEIEDLKAAWRADPSFDLCNSEGFEAHKYELARWEDASNARWGRELEWQREAAIRARMVKLPCSRKLAEYLVDLEETIANLQHAVRKLEHPNGRAATRYKPWKPKLGLIARV